MQAYWYYDWLIPYLFFLIPSNFSPSFPNNRTTNYAWSHIIAYTIIRYIITRNISMIFLSPERMFQRNVFLLHQKLIEPLLRVKEKKKKNQKRKGKRREGEKGITPSSERLKIVGGRLRLPLPSVYLSPGIVNASRGMLAGTRDHRSH